ncbi:MAG: threonine--tRNA ligase [Gammaproteobacteria bacterium]|nr:threonine--tRNA ligase [Gammaproteobacteria bacterium]MYF02410.1 threonine--tRNA ligase [Gammaproteobacteria bacterium]MYI77788.1 threonine--tRNA ligase [Gammaproteobacteria bacterium]
MSFEHQGEFQSDDDQLYRVRHSLAHVLAQAVLQFRPGSTLGFGPPIKDGFYYDFALSEQITDADFPEIERLMKKILKSGQRFYQENLSKNDALARLEEMGEPYKQEYAEELCDKHNLDSLSFYRNGSFVDMCEGPHVDTTKEIPRDSFKLRSVAGAYWRGDSNNQMLTRIYAWAFLSKEELDSYVQAYELAQERDHKKLGKQLGIYTIDNDIGRGLPLWLPNGTIIRDELEKLAFELEFQAGYQRVSTPHIAKQELFFQTGHLPYYAEDMYPPMELVEQTDHGEKVKEAYVLKPMNCPHHHKIFDAEPRSYRELPLRLAEYSHVYRFEESGAVGGLVRVRGMCMNDAHIYCTEEQIKSEFRNVMELYAEAYRILGLESYYLRLSKSDPEDPKRKQKYVDNPSAWIKSEAIIEELLNEMEVDFVIGVGEAAFYGPKIDVQFPTVTGRDESVSTVQLDFAVPARLGLSYVGSDGLDHVPYCIHRAPLSTHERIVAYLIEHYGGAFPTWLSPVQVKVITVSDQFHDYGRKIVSALRARFIRAELAEESDTVSKKVRAATVNKIPNLLIVGSQEEQDRTVTLRRYGIREQLTLPFEQFQDSIQQSIDQRAAEFRLDKS